MSVGLTVTKEQVDNLAGSYCRDFNSTLARADEFSRWLSSTNDAELTSLGYTAGEIADLRAAIAALDELRNIYRGNAALAEAKNFRNAIKKLYGFGF